LFDLEEEQKQLIEEMAVLSDGKKEYEIMVYLK